MIEGANPMVQALLGGLLTWGLTALGAGAVFAPFHTQNKKLLDSSLGFAAGVMTAASYWSLLAPGIERAEVQMAKWAFLPISLGFLAGAAFVYAADALLPFLGFSSEDMVSAFLADQEPPAPVPNDRSSDRAQQALERRRSKSRDQAVINGGECDVSSAAAPTTGRRQLRSSASSYGTAVSDSQQSGTEQLVLGVDSSSGVRKRTQHQSRKNDRAVVKNTSNLLQDVAAVADDDPNVMTTSSGSDRILMEERALSWRRVLLLIIAITVHNIPEGLAVGVAFGAIGKAASATYESALSLAIGIGIQNFPEGMAVSLPLAGFGYSRTRSFFYGQLSGMVEPIAALCGAAIVTLIDPILPYALSFAAGAMIYVVFDDIVPEAQLHGNGKLASWAAIVGFIVMMSLDVSLG